jgi:chromosome segregation ATPase
MLSRSFLISSILLIFFIGIPSAENYQEITNGSKLSPQTDVQALEGKINTIRKEIRKPKDVTEHKILSDDLDKVKKDVLNHETRLEQNQILKTAKEKQKLELESRLEIRERQQAKDPQNTDLQQKVDSLKKQINGLNDQIQDIEKNTKEDRDVLEKELIPKREKLQNDFDKHPITKKQAELKASEKDLAYAKNKANNDKLIQGLHKLNSGMNTFSVGKYLSVGREAEIKILSPDNPSNGFLDRLIKLAVRTLGTFAVLMLIIAGYFMLTSEGDENRLQKGKNILLYTIIGLLVAFTSYIMVQFVLSILYQ